MTCTRILAPGFLASALIIAACNSPARTIRPVIHVMEEDHFAAMKSAPLIVREGIQSVKEVSDLRMVEPPKEAGDSMTDGGYLHTVGDYPAYDVELPSRWLPAFLSEWNRSQQSTADLFERIEEARLRAELSGIQDIQGTNWSSDTLDWMGLTSPFFVVSKLDSYCLAFPNSYGRFAACEFTRFFPGRCRALLSERAITVSMGFDAALLSAQFESCEGQMAQRIEDSRSSNWPLPFQYGWRETPARRGMRIRVYASAMDAPMHKAACEAAAAMLEANDIPECSTPAR